MATIQIIPDVPDPEAVRDAFGQLAYSGVLPKDRWLEAQDLVGRYDDAQDGATRAAIAGRMTTMTHEVEPDAKRLPQAA